MVIMGLILFCLFFVCLICAFVIRLMYLRRHKEWSTNAKSALQIEAYSLRRRLTLEMEQNADARVIIRLQSSKLSTLDTYGEKRATDTSRISFACLAAPQRNEEEMVVVSQNVEGSDAMCFDDRYVHFESDADATATEMQRTQAKEEVNDESTQVQKQMEKIKEEEIAKAGTRKIMHDQFKRLYMEHNRSESEGEQEATVTTTTRGHVNKYTETDTTDTGTKDRNRKKEVKEWNANDVLHWLKQELKAANIDDVSVFQSISKAYQMNHVTDASLLILDERILRYDFGIAQ